MNPLSNARHEGESFDDYKVRRLLMNRRIKQHLRGKFAHVSATVIRLDMPLCADDQKAVERGLIRSLCPPLVGEGGKLFCMGVHKGKSFAYADRKAHRQAVLAERRAR